MLDRHAVQALLEAGHPTHKIAQQFGVSLTGVGLPAEPPAIAPPQPPPQQELELGY